MLMDTDFTQRFNTYTVYLRAFAFKLTRDFHGAEDLFQDTAFLAFKNQHSFRRDTDFKAWISTIMRNTFINKFRKKKRRRTINVPYDKDQLQTSGEVVSNEGEGNLMMEEMLAVIRGLKEHQREAFMLAYQGYKYEEISKELKIPVGTVKSRIFQARENIKRNLRLDYSNLLKNKKI